MFILIYLLGLSLLFLISSRDFKITERLALAMPMGLGLTTFIMFLLDRATHAITIGGVLMSVAICAIAMAAIRAALDLKAGDPVWKRPRPKVDMSWLTLVWIAFAGITSYLVYGIAIKGLYWPTHDFDAIEGYDLLSKAIAHEHTIANSVLTNAYIVQGCGPRLLYPPLFALSNSLCYMTGMEMPGIVTTSFFISWAFMFYLLLRRFVSPTNAIIFTFLTVTIPEMFYRASVCGTNLPCAIYSTCAVMAFLVWYNDRDKEGFFYLSYISIIFSIWTRSEAVLFLAPIMGVLLFMSIREKTFKHIIIYATSVIPFLAWNMFLKAHVTRAQTEFFEPKLFYDGAKMKQILDAAWGLMKASNLYGLTFYILIGAFFLGIIINIATNFQRNKFVLGALVLWLVIAAVAGINLFTLILFFALIAFSTIWNGERWELLAIFVLSLGAYTLLFYQMKNNNGDLFNPGGWMQSGYKRGLFSYAPLAYFYIATSKWVNLAFTKLDEKMAIFKKPAA